MLGGANHWVSYWSSDPAHSGLNDQQAALGRITKSGKDYRHRAGEPYDFTVELVDTKNLAFGTWTRNGDIKDPLYSYAAWDFEPLLPPQRRAKPHRPAATPKPGQTGAIVPLTPAGSRIAENPTIKHRARVYREAANCYDTLYHLHDPRILAIYLVESSPNHYHVAVLFTHHLTQSDHDAIVATVRANTDPFKNLDKDSSRAKRGIGTQFRAPFTWKHRIKARCIRWYCDNEAQLINRGESLRPPGLRARLGCKPAFDSTIKDPTDKDILLAWAIQHYPIKPHTRNQIQASLILSLLDRKIDVDTIRHIGPLWLQHFNNQEQIADPDLQNFKTDQAEAEARFHACIDYTLKNADLTLGSKPTYDYPTLIDQYQTTPAQFDLIKRILQSRTELSSSSCHEEEDNLNPEAVPLSNGRGEVSQDFCFIEAVLVQLAINRLKGVPKDRLRCTHQQLIEIIRRRHNMEIDPRQLQRVKRRFCSLAHADGSRHPASRVELLVEIVKGTPGIESVYAVSDIIYRLCRSR
jgi:hypothetical protein